MAEASGGWVRRAQPDPHSCPHPQAVVGPVAYPQGRLGDLWRCPACGRLWRIGRACGLCDVYGQIYAHGGSHGVGQAWRPARDGQRFTVWLRSRFGNVIRVGRRG